MAPPVDPHDILRNLEARAAVLMAECAEWQVRAEQAEALDVDLATRLAATEQELLHLQRALLQAEARAARAKRKG